MEKKLTRNEVDNLCNQFIEIRYSLIKMIENEVKEKGEISVPEDDDFDEVFTICYNGGNHPEYNSNAYSQIYKVKWNDETYEVYIYTEDGVQSLDECDFDSVGTVAEFLLFMQTYTPQK